MTLRSKLVAQSIWWKKTDEYYIPHISSRDCHSQVSAVYKEEIQNVHSDRKQFRNIKLEGCAKWKRDGGKGEYPVHQSRDRKLHRIVACRRILYWSFV